MFAFYYKWRQFIRIEVIMYLSLELSIYSYPIITSLKTHTQTDGSTSQAHKIGEV